MSTYQCSTCGKISSDKSEICKSQEEITPVYMCESCNCHSIGPGSLCKAKEVTPSYYCNKCGTSATKKTSLCDPMHV